MILQEKIEPIYYLHFHWISGQIVPIFRLQGLYNELLASSLIVRIVFRVSSPLTIRGNKVFQVSQGWTFDHMGAVSVILGSMEGVSWHGFRDKKIGAPFICFILPLNLELSQGKTLSSDKRYLFALELNHRPPEFAPVKDTETMMYTKKYFKYIN